LSRKWIKFIISICSPIIGSKTKCVGFKIVRLAIRDAFFLIVFTIYLETRLLLFIRNKNGHPRSPDTPCDFLLWGYIKEKVYRTPPALRQRIIDEFEILRQNRELIQSAVRAMESRARRCIERNGGHVEGHYA